MAIGGKPGPSRGGEPMDALFVLERDIKGRTPQERVRVRNERSRPPGSPAGPRDYPSSGKAIADPRIHATHAAPFRLFLASRIFFSFSIQPLSASVRPHKFFKRLIGIFRLSVC
jgi:hypothetical protein